MDVNVERILQVERFFGRRGRPLVKPGRVLVGEGLLKKKCRHNQQPRMFFLFNDILVYGSIFLPGRMYKRQNVIPLENLVLEDLEDGLEDGLESKNQWLIRSPRKSFYVLAASPQEKTAWIQHIQECRAKLLQCRGSVSDSCLAATWVPDHASALCMRCFCKFSVTQRRHHCRHCGFVVCNSCSKARFLLQNISPKPVRVCLLCHQDLQAQGTLDRGDELSGPVYELSSTEDSDQENSDPVTHQWTRQQSPVESTWSPFIALRMYHIMSNSSPRTWD